MRLGSTEGLCIPNTAAKISKAFWEVRDQLLFHCYIIQLYQEQLPIRAKECLVPSFSEEKLSKVNILTC